ncbi:MAG: hypothetical protein IJ083_13895 [Clostridia bacterium]|nr:hypothetical protein [Clostridia bacterium]
MGRGLRERQTDTIQNQKIHGQGITDVLRCLLRRLSGRGGIPLHPGP